MRERRFLFLVVLFSLVLSLNTYAQRYYPDYGGRNIADVVGRSLDLVFGGIVQPIVDVFNFSGFNSAIRLCLWIILYIIFSWSFGMRFGEKLPKKFSKVIGAILALLCVVFIPEFVLEILFRDLLGGLAGFLLIMSFLFLPLYGLYKFYKGKDDRMINFLAAIGFFMMFLFIDYIQYELIYLLNFGLMQNLSSIAVVFATLINLIFFIHALSKTFKSGDGRNPEREERREKSKREEDESGRVKEMASGLANLINDVIEHIKSLSNEPISLAYYLTLQSLNRRDGLSFINTQAVTNLHNNVMSISRELSKIKKEKRRKAEELNARIVNMWNNLHGSLNVLSSIRRELSTNIGGCVGNAHLYDPRDINSFRVWLNRQHPDLNDFFRRVNDILNQIERDLEVLRDAVLGVGGL